MAVGERIQFFRKLRGMTQKYLGTQVGFPEKSADVRLAQYESYLGLMHTLFTLEDRYGLTVKEIDGEPCLCVAPSKGRDAQELWRSLNAWREQAARLEAGEISKEEYDRWRYRYPEYDPTRIWAKVIPQGLSDMLTEKLKKDK